MKRIIETIKEIFRTDSFDHLYSKVKNNTYCDKATLLSLANLSMLLEQTGVAGDIVECGTYKGGSAAVIARHVPDSRHIWLYDSFQGMPITTEIDGEDAKEWIGGCLASEENVRDLFSKLDISPERYTIVKGWFNETFGMKLPECVAMLHCDADWYESVTLVLETFYPIMPDGAVIVLDDFGAWEGCREAFFDFCSRNNVKPLLERVSVSQAFWIKGKTHNRT